MVLSEAGRSLHSARRCRASAIASLDDPRDRCEDARQHPSEPLDRSHTAGTVGGRASVEREQLLEILVELLDVRRLLARLGGDLKTVARRSGA